VKRIKILLIGIFLVFFVFPIGHTPYTNSVAQEKEIYPLLKLLARVIATVQQNFVEEVEVEKLITDALKGMISSLDPYSQFMTPEARKEMEMETKGKFGGVGMVISRKEDIITVVSPIEDTPAFRKGVQSGDKIVEIDGEATRGWTTSEAAQKLRGDPGTNVTIKIWREGEEDLLTIEITREIIHIKSIKGSRIINDHIGYLRVVAFRKDTHQRLKEELEKLLEKGADSLILDLRNNPGGLLNSAIRVTDEFLPPGELVVFTEGREGRGKRNYLTRKDPSFPSELPMVILVNNGSASASEIVAGALKDWQRATLIGNKTFGKGSVQSIISLDDKYALRLTTSHYYSPKGNRIEDQGIKPDIEVEISKEEKKEIQKAAIGYQKPEEFKDSQLEKAIQFLSGEELEMAVTEAIADTSLEEAK